MLDAYWSVSTEQALGLVGSNREGLEEADAEMRLRRDGPYSVGDTEQRSPLRLLLRQFVNPLALILLFGAGISIALREWLDAGIILAIVGGSGILSFSQEFRASKAVAALRQRLALKVRVLREGRARDVPVAEVVRGDIVERPSHDIAGLSRKQRRSRAEL